MAPSNRADVSRRTVLAGTALLALAPGSGAGLNSPDSDEGAAAKPTWNRTYGGDGYETFEDLVAIDDGYAIVGSVADSTESDADIWLVRVDADGDELWSRTYGGSGADSGESIVRTDDGGYLVVGRTTSFGQGPMSGWVIRIDAEGNECWSQTYGTDDVDSLTSVVPDGDGNFLLGGWMQPSPVRPPGRRAWLVKVDGDGDELWRRSYGRAGDTQVNSLVRGDTGYVFVGSLNDPSTSSSTRAWAVGIDDEGETLWEATYDSGRFGFATDVVRGHDGGYVFSAEISPSDGRSIDAQLVQIDADGEVLWNRTYARDDRVSYTDLATSLVRTTDGGYAFVGNTRGFDRENEQMDDRSWLVTVDGEGNERSRRLFGRETGDPDIARSLVTTDDGYVFGGVMRRTDSDNFDGWLVKTTSGPRYSRDDIAQEKYGRPFARLSARTAAEVAELANRQPFPGGRSPTEILTREQLAARYGHSFDELSRETRIDVQNRYDEQFGPLPSKPDYAPDDISRAKYRRPFDELSRLTAARVRELYNRQPFAAGLAPRDVRTRDDLAREKHDRSFGELSRESAVSVQDDFDAQFA